APAPAPAPAPTPTGTVTIAWTAPAKNIDGSTLTDISGYRVIYGTSPSTLNASVDVAGATTTSRSITGLSAGTYYFAVMTLNATATPSAPSNIGSVAVQ